MLALRRILAAEADAFLTLARAFHAEDGHRLDAAGEASIREVADRVALVPAARGRGLGMQAMALALDEARRLGVRVLLLEVEAGNERAYRLYLKMGFHDTRRRLLRLHLADGGGG